MKHKPPVFVIGLDAADHLLTELWMAEGYLPSLACMKQRGAFGPLESTAAICSGSAWPSMVTSSNPAMNGMYCRYQLDNGTYHVRRIRAEDNQLQPFWAAMSLNSVIVDVPKTPLDPNINGVQIVEWGAYDHYAQFSYLPESVSQDILEKVGDHPMMQTDFEVNIRSRRDFETQHTELLECVQKKHQLNLSLINNYQPEFFLSVFGETHAAGHALFRFQDQSHPLFDANHSLHNALRDVYCAIDEAIGEFSQALPDDAVLVVVSSHGFTQDSMADEDFLVDLLVQIGMSVPKHQKLMFAPYAPDMSLDMARTRAFGLHTDQQGYIRINLQSREPNGIVHPDDYDATCREITESLLSYRHRDSDAPLVSQVIQMNQVFDGPHTNALPDLSVIWNTDQIVTDVVSPIWGVLTHQPDLSSGGGNHRGAGWILIDGPGISQADISGQGIDLAPTLASLLGQKPPDGWQGKSLLQTGNPALAV